MRHKKHASAKWRSLRQFAVSGPRSRDGFATDTRNRQRRIGDGGSETEDRRRRIGDGGSETEDRRRRIGDGGSETEDQRRRERRRRGERHKPRKRRHGGTGVRSTNGGRWIDPLPAFWPAPRTRAEHGAADPSAPSMSVKGAPAESTITGQSADGDRLGKTRSADLPRRATRGGRVGESTQTNGRGSRVPLVCVLSPTLRMPAAGRRQISRARPASPSVSPCLRVESLFRSLRTLHPSVSDPPSLPLRLCPSVSAPPSPLPRLCSSVSARALPTAVSRSPSGSWPRAHTRC